MVTILILCIPLTALAVGFLTLKSVQLGLRWQIETKQEQQPTMEAPIQNPIAPIMEAKQEKETESIFNEWVHGAEESR
jgi:hypothetical protein